MGNCMQANVRQETCKKFVQVMGMDGKLLECTSPLVVGDLMRESDCEEDCMVVHSRNVGHALPKENKIKGGELYYLVPSPMEADHKAVPGLKNSNSGGKKRSKDFADTCGNGLVNVENGFRLKIVVSRHQLKTLLLDSCLKKILVEQHVGKRTQQQDCVSGKEWRPCLETIAEES